MREAKRQRRPQSGQINREAASKPSFAASGPSATAGKPRMSGDYLRLEAERHWAQSERTASKTARRKQRRVEQRAKATSVEDQLARAKVKIALLEHRRGSTSRG